MARTVTLTSISDAPELCYHNAMKKARKAYIERLLHSCYGDTEVMARKAGLSRMHIYRLLNEAGLKHIAKDTRQGHEINWQDNLTRFRSIN